MTMLVCLTLTLFSCSKDDDELGVEAGIVGKWEISSINIMVNDKPVNQFIEEMAKELGITPEEYREEYGDFDADLLDITGTMEFKDDKTFIITVDGAGNNNGSWNAGQERTMILNYGDNNTETYDVKTLKSSSAALSVKNTQTGEIGGKDMEMNIETIVNLKR